jgi:hypothetical protein
MVAVRGGIALVLGLLLVDPALGQTWVGGHLFVSTDNTKSTAIYIYDTTPGQTPTWNITPGVWHQIDLTTLHVPTEAVGVFLSGELVTSGYPGIYCGIIGTVRAPGSVMSGLNYNMASVTSVPGGAFRENASIFAPVVNGVVEWYWTFSNAACPMIVNLSLQAIVLPDGVTPDPPPALTVPAISASLSGGMVTATITNGPANVYDWVAIHLASANDATYLSWKFLNGTQTASTGYTTATVTFPAPSTGLYNIRLYANGGYTKLATSGIVVVP